MKIYRSFSSTETERLGCNLGRKILRKKPKVSAIVLGLQGEIGSGKTVFVRGFFRGLGLRSKIVSPTFILMRRVPLKHKRFKNVFHVDVYRIKNPKELRPLQFKEILGNPENIVLIEWADRIKKVLPKRSLWLRFSHGDKEKERMVRI